jgi:hypothetical protein
METITLRVRRGGATELRQLTLSGHRLLAGHADTGIFTLVENDTPSAMPQPPKPARGTRRHYDDGLANATIEITEPLALAEPSHANRGGRTFR